MERMKVKGKGRYRETQAAQAATVVCGKLEVMSSREMGSCLYFFVLCLLLRSSSIIRRNLTTDPIHEVVVSIKVMMVLSS